MPTNTKRRLPPITRDLVMFSVAIGLIIYRTIYPPIDPALVPIIGGMLGGPLVLRADERRRSKK